ncbi:S8 family peptidase [Aquimarina sp. LLG6339-5]|uniref:S8 family peptidase n=1 Tax=Aquimarina sp. LLG6339-5 TaxID=3160830 RepID=UPI0038688A6D
MIFLKQQKKIAKSIISTLLLSSIFTSCESELDNELTTLSGIDTQQKILTRKEINQFIFETTESNQTSFDWNMASQDILWSAIIHSNNEVMIGYKKEEWNNIDVRNYIFENSQDKNGNVEILNIKKDLIHTLQEGIENKTNKEEIIIEENDRLLSFTIKIFNIETLRSIATSSTIRYIEPMYDLYQEANNHNSISKDNGNLGCGSDNPRYDLRRNYDYVDLSPGGKMGWNFKYHKIKETWDWGGISSKGNGKGIGIAILDTGLSHRQGQLTDGFSQGNEYMFNEGLVQNRTIKFSDKYGSNGSNPIDECGHGTALSGVIASPRAKYGIHGVAYGCNLYNYRANSDVFINGTKDITAVANSFIAAANTSNVRIISMSMGSVTRSSRIADAIVYAYRKGKLIFAAAGTTKFGSFISGQYPNLPNIVFPANMTEYNGDVVYGVTGIRTNYTACNDCVKGKNVDFAVVMEQLNGTQALATGKGGLYATTIGGSSVATATMAGIAALVWGKNTALPRADVVLALKQKSDYPFRTNPIFGYGKVNALEAYKYFDLFGGF